MNNRGPHFALACVLACILLLGTGIARANDDKFYWLTNYAEALREAKRTGKPIFLEYRCEP